ncbi:MAG: pirin family protein [Candidatus Eremiobacteraeota bacterium]|nr:pirin family protein [Candidatus Eremiobacteraeota bacterium]
METSSILPAHPVFAVQRAADRATYDHGWLLTSHSFSFAEYYDPRNINWGALRVFNDDRVAAGQGFPTHPHRDMEIVTYVLSGQLEHRDSIGNNGVVEAGGVQYMSAGVGLRHSEFNHSDKDELHFLQMWVLPGRIGGEPSYGQVDFDLRQRRNQWLAVASGRESVDAAVELTQDAALLVSRLENVELRHTFEPARLGFLFVADGDMDAEAFNEHNEPSGSVSLSAGDGVRLAGITRLRLQGTGEAVLWDVPRLHDDAND